MGGPQVVQKKSASWQLSCFFPFSHCSVKTPLKIRKSTSSTQWHDFIFFFGSSKEDCLVIVLFVDPVVVEPVQTSGTIDSFATQNT